MRILGNKRVLELQIDHRQRALPVVRVKDIREEVDCPHHLEDRSAEECESFAVVIASVEFLALEIIFVVEKIEGDTVLYGAPNSAE